MRPADLRFSRSRFRSFVWTACGVVGLLVGTAPAAQAESLRCSGGIADEGDSRMAVLVKCGPPLMKDAACAPVYWRGSPEPLPEPLARAWFGCQPVEDWLYDRGPGNLLATVRFGNGQVRSIVYGRVPR